MLQKLDLDKVGHLLNEIISHELAGVIRYTHYAIMITGTARLSLVNFFKQQANESLIHAQQAGEILTGLGGHPTMKVHHIEESHNHGIERVIHESMAHESTAAALYMQLLEEVTGKSIYLEEYARNMISSEELHSLEMRKMLRHFT
jgi:bacterioferritin